MELDNKNGMAKQEAVTYVFTTNQEGMVPDGPSKLQAITWQIVPSVWASLLCIPFGLMLGWPSPTYPMLLQPSTPIIISMDQSAMIAGFLMIGNALGTPLSAKKFVRPKYGILLGVAIMTSGWLVMWQARDIYWLLGSRILTGFGNGFGVGQLKIYISNMCEEELKATLWKQINLYAFFGVIVIYSFGPYLEFRQTSMVSVIISICIFFVLLFLPSTPEELIRAKQFKEAKRIINYIKPHVDASSEINRIALNTKKSKEYSLLAIVKAAQLRRNFYIFAFLVFCQQFSGLPATIIYTQMLFEKSEVPYPIYFAIIYAIIYFISNILGVFVFSKYNKRTVLLYSSSGVSILIVAKILVIYYDINQSYWRFTSVAVMYLYVIVHTVGLGNVPFTLISDLFPKNCRTSVTHFFVMFHSILALIITKIFQVLMSQYHVGTPFCLFLCVSFMAFIFVYFVLPNKTDKVSNVEIFVKN